MKLLKKSENFLSDERGAASVIEAAFIYPVTVLVVAALIFMGVYVFESVFLDVRAQMTADMAAKNISFSGYDELGDTFSVYDFLDDGIAPGKSRVNKAYEDRKPYRYFTKTDVDGRYKEEAEKYAGGLFFAANTECSVEVNRHMFGRQVTVTMSENIRMPGFFRIIGLREDYQLSVSSSALTSDSAEFIRNTDLAVDTAEFISEKTGAKEKFSDIKEKISEFLGNLKAGSE